MIFMRMIRDIARFKFHKVLKFLFILVFLESIRQKVKSRAMAPNFWR